MLRIRFVLNNNINAALFNAGLSRKIIVYDVRLHRKKKKRIRKTVAGCALRGSCRLSLKNCSDKDFGVSLSYYNNLKAMINRIAFNETRGTERSFGVIMFVVNARGKITFCVHRKTKKKNK